MTLTIRIARTQPDALTELGVQGQPIRQRSAQLRSVLAAAPPPANRLLLAEPVPEPRDGTVEWFAETDGEVKPYAEARAAEASEIAKVLVAALDWVETESGRLLISEDPKERLLGELLEQSFEIPGLDSLYFADGHPILINWGTLAAGSDPERNILRRAFPGRGHAFERHAERTPRSLLRRRTFFGFPAIFALLGSAVLMIGVMFLTMRSCGLAVPFTENLLVDFCEETASAEGFGGLERSLGDQQALQDAIGAARVELAELEGQCRPPSALVTPRLTPPGPTLTACNQANVAQGEKGRTRHPVMLGSQPGTVQVGYCMQSIPDTIVVRYDGEIVAHKENAKGDGTLSFEYNPISGIEEVIVEMRAPQDGTSWSFIVGCPGQTLSFSC